jgi:hypothetical protein
MNEPRLKLETQDCTIIISLPGTSYQVTFRKLADDPGMSASHNIQDDEDAPQSLHWSSRPRVGCRQGQGARASGGLCSVGFGGRPPLWLGKRKSPASAEPFLTVPPSTSSRESRRRDNGPSVARLGRQPVSTLITHLRCPEDTEGWYSRRRDGVFPSPSQVPPKRNRRSPESHPVSRASSFRQFSSALSPSHWRASMPWREIRQKSSRHVDRPHS